MSKRSDVLSGTIVSLVGLIFLLSTIGMRKPRIGLGSAGFPRLVTACLIICGVLLIVRASLSKKEYAARSRTDSRFAFSLVGLIASFILYIYLFKKLGFILTTGPLLFFAMYVFGSKKILLNVVLSVVTSIAIYYVFTIIFKIPLPRFSL
ncbi:hypothetical protein AS159_00735 [Thermotoga sp. Ku-13t]|uniref:tripartite tricarboxylate transporter TctB family protein n=1 Tax=Thermotoga sp. Ku-13t TaxID=1755813 RepID=UPI0013ED0A28|nr:tripartite tricarboxylate transporter TctB family protein [Thermotoga sp. Ku-13t]KAF2958275.1 hypothetical protein AS159_00735 [Thermotoga sp. Ku-13t]